MVTRDSDPLEIRVWVTPTGQLPRPTEVQTEGVENLEWVVKAGTDEYHLEP